MRVFYAFITGLAVGGATVLAVLGYLGRLAPLPPKHTNAPVAVSPPGEETHAPEGSESDDISSESDRVVSAPNIPAGLMVPVLGVRPDQLTNTYDQARGGGTRKHEALDIMAPRGTEVVAAANGTIRKLFLSRAGGITIYQEGEAGRLMYYYAHLERYAPSVREGMRVAKGDVIGYVGSSGNASPESPHLHFAIFRLPPTKEWWKGEPLNPYPLLVAKR